MQANLRWNDINLKHEEQVEEEKIKEVNIIDTTNEQNVKEEN